MDEREQQPIKEQKEVMRMIIVFIGRVGSSSGVGSLKRRPDLLQVVILQD